MILHHPTEGINKMKWEMYACEYQLDGKQWSVLVCANSFTDAAKRLRAIGTTGQVLGNNVIEVPSAPGVGLLVRAWCWIANLFGARP